MERITYRKTLDVHKNGVQFMLQGFETADNMSRVIEISLMASGDAIDFPLERMVAMMYVTTPSAKEPSINKCTIKDNKVVYEVLPIVEEGITEMQLKLIETSPEGATSVLASPKFSVEVTKSGAHDDGAELKTTFTAIEEFIAKADAAYGSRLERIELDSQCIFKAYYADGTVYDTDVLQKLFMNGNVLLSESFAHGGTGIRAGEDTDNSKYYSNVSKSEALNAKNIMENSEDILEEVKLHGVYTAFSVDFNTGEVEYVSPSFKFKVNPETGDLDAEGQTYTFEDEIGRVVEAWLGERGVALSELQAISSRHSSEIKALQEKDESLQETIDAHTKEIKELGEDVLPRISDLEWTTLGSVSYSQSYTSTTGGESVEKTDSLVIPGDEDLLKDFTNFRYVLKKGSAFCALNTIPVFDFYSKSYEMRFLLEGCKMTLVRLENISPQNDHSKQLNKIEFTCENDEVIHIMGLEADNILFVDTTIRGGTTNSPSDLFNISCKHHHKLSGDQSYDITTSASFTIELQGKR